jgi:hypothetical protein
MVSHETLLCSSEVERPTVNRVVVGSIPTEAANKSRVEKWSSRQPHALEIVGSNPTPATNKMRKMRKMRKALIPFGSFFDYYPWVFRK